ncbi:hypothetical protein [Tamlana sp. I1]|uniref:hypothetical protein n=1 Tax=Tamlana sp. I1 TaxID=2762061 RepID=UPI00189044E2|nr:hypothetical protein [Tamlana sp. I1]
MKNIKILIASFLMLGIVSLVASCDPENHSLGKTLDKSDIDFDIVQDFTTDPGGNTVIMTNNTPGVTLTWDYVTGKSNKAKETVKYAFKGDYTIKITAVTAGGLVELDPVTITVTDDNLSYVDDPLWNLLSGGVGNSKTWLLDLDANGDSKYFAGPMYFYGTDNAWLEGGEAWEGGDTGCYGDDCWNWSPDWKGNQWIATQGDYGTMTFSLDGGPFLTTNHLMIPSYGEESGTYFLDIDAKTLTTSNATILHTNENDACVDNWGIMKVFSITENSLQLGVLRKDSCDGPATLVFNFITKEYSDNWVPEEIIPEQDEGFEPTFASGELLQILTGGPAAGRFWKLDGNGNPVDWLAGGIGWTTSASSSYNWGWNDTWTSIADNSWIRFDQYGGLQNYYKNENGVESTGTFTIDEATNEVFLNDSAMLIANPGHFMSPTTSSFTVIKAVSETFETTGLWFGTSYDAAKDEWFAFHYVINNNVSGGGGSAGGGGSSGTEITFDTSKLVIGDLEGNGNLRLELYNEYGSTAADSGLNKADLAFSNSIEVTFTLNGITLNSGAVGTYNTSMYYADADWNPNGNGDVITVNGDGTYTVKYAPGTAADGVVVFVIDVVGMATDITDITAVTATIDSVVVN